MKSVLDILFATVHFCIESMWDYKGGWWIVLLGAEYLPGGLYNGNPLVYFDFRVTLLNFNFTMQVRRRPGKLVKNWGHRA
jgi:hypothetical protein